RRAADSRQRSSWPGASAPAASCTRSCARSAPPAFPGSADVRVGEVVAPRWGYSDTDMRRPSPGGAQALAGRGRSHLLTRPAVSAKALPATPPTPADAPVALRRESRSRDREHVRALVELGVRVPAHPVPADTVVARDLGVERPHEVLVL